MFTVSAKVFSKALLLGTLLVALGFSFGCGKKPEPTAAEVIETARLQAAAGGHTPAIQTLENYLAEHPGAFDVIDALAFTASEAGDPMLAAFYFARAAEVDPSQPEYLLYAAAALSESGDRAGAAESYRRYLTIRPADAAVWTALAELNENMGNRSAALDAHLQANRSQPSGASQVAIGRHYLQARNFAQAQSWFAAAAQRNDGYRDEALLGLTEIALRASRFADAEQLVATLDTEFPGAVDQSSLGDVRRQLSTWRRTLAEAEAAVAALSAPPAPAETAPPAESPPEPDSSPSTPEPPAPDPSTPTEIAASQDTAAEVPESPTLPVDTTSVAAADPTVSEPMEPSETPETPEPVETAAPAPQTFDDFLRLARRQVLAGDFSEAIRNFQRALARDSSRPEIWRELSEAQFQNEDHIAAPASASEAMQRAPNEPQYLLQYLRVAAPTMPQQRLVRELEAARLRFPTNPAITLTLARAYDDAGSRGYAERMYQEFLRLAASNHPNRPEVEDRLGIR